MRVFLCDDDTRDVSRLAKLIRKYGTDNNIKFCIDSYSSGEELLDDILTEKNVDMIFLDINLARMNGIEIAGKIREKNESVPIIFITAYINYALEGYKVRANRFLVKDDLENTFSECMDDICKEIIKKRKSMMFRCVDGDRRINLSDISLFETSGRQVIIHSADKTFQMYEKLNSLEEEMESYGFIRIHRFYLVNVRYISNIHNYELSLTDGKKLPIPKGRYKEVRVKYTLFMGEVL